MQYQEAVAEARTLVKRSEEAQWRLAELTWEQVESGISRRQWAKDIGVAASWAMSLYTAWQTWGDQGTDHRPPFSQAMQEIHNPKRAEEIQELGSDYAAKVRTGVRNMPPEEKAEVVREALDDPDTAVRVLRDPHTRRNVTDAREQVANEIEDTAEARTDADPTGRAIRDAARSLNVEAAASKARFWTAEITRLLQELPDRPDDLNERLTDLLDEIEVAVGWARTAIEGGQVNDDELARLLEGGI